jgi:hypothetical protein
MAVDELDPSKGGDDGFFVCKYLTASHLLRLQVVDPQLRMQIITQLWVRRLA